MTDRDSRVEAMAAHMEAATAAEAGDEGGFVEAAGRLGFELEETPDESADEVVDEVVAWDDDEPEWDDDEPDEPDRDARLNARMDQLEALQQPQQQQWQPQPTEEERGLRALESFDQHVSELAEGCEYVIDADDRRELFRESRANGFTYAATQAAFQAMTEDWDLYDKQRNGKGWERSAARQERMARAIRRASRDNEQGATDA